MLLYILNFRTPSTAYFTSTLVKTGFKMGGVYALTTELLIREEFYMQKEGPFDQKWRNMDRYNYVLLCKNSSLVPRLSP